MLHGVDLDRDVDAVVDHVVSGFGRLEVHPDVPDGIRALRASGRRLVTLTNGSTTVSEQLLGGVGIREEFEALLSVEDAGAARAGLTTAWIDRAGTPYPECFTPPAIRATGLTDLADRLA